MSAASNRPLRRKEMPEYRSWRCMRSRCYWPKNASYRHYGAKGITVCDEWRDDFEAFFRDMGPRPEACTLDRIEGDLGYFKGNCRWATPVEQAANRRINREIRSEIAKRVLAVRWAGHIPKWKLAGLKKSTFYKRLRKAAERAARDAAWFKNLHQLELSIA